MTPETLASCRRWLLLGSCLGVAAGGCGTKAEPVSGGAGGGAASAAAGNTTSGGGGGGHEPARAGSGGGGSGGSTLGGSTLGGSMASLGGTSLGGSPATAHGGSADAGAGGDAGGDSSTGAVPGIIAVGYGGLRIVSRDLGKTWEDETHWSTDGGDDEDLLRTIAYGNGVWVSAGWRLVTSVDGVKWSDHGKTRDVIAAVHCNLTDGMAFGAGQFLVACGSNLASSTDGLSWTNVGPTPAVGKHPYLLWDEAEKQFVCSGDDGPSFVSADGKAWTKLAIERARLCDGGLAPTSECKGFYTEGVMLTTEWGGVIRRSTDGSSFEKTYQDQFENNLFTEYSFGVGRVAP